jgi:bifunctional oligoribonuclease and PAP phosphatase NrnA
MITTEQFQQAVEFISKARRLLVTTHAKPDGDACGSVAAMTEVLRHLGKDVYPLFLSPVPAWYQFLFSDPIPILGQQVSEEDLIQGRLGPFDLVILVDVNSVGQLPKFDQYLKTQRPPVLVIDHHATSDGLGTFELVDPTAAATGLVVFELLRFAGWSVTPQISEALFVAAATDTGWFQFGNANSRVYRLCADLIDSGARPAAVYGRLYQNFPYSRFRLMLAMLNSLELHFDGRFALQYIRRADFERSNATYEDTENLINECHRIGKVLASALLVELEDGRIRCSLRSRSSAGLPTGGSIDVSRIAERFGGGGHKMAAGTFLPGPLEQAAERIRSEFAPFFIKA